MCGHGVRGRAMIQLFLAGDSTEDIIEFEHSGTGFQRIKDRAEGVVNSRRRQQKGCNT